jgi:hypothetical protein
VFVRKFSEFIIREQTFLTARSITESIPKCVDDSDYPYNDVAEDNVLEILS